MKTQKWVSTLEKLFPVHVDYPLDREAYGTSILLSRNQCRAAVKNPLVTCQLPRIGL